MPAENSSRRRTLLPVILRDETHFAPYDDVPTALIGLAASAQAEIRIDVYGFTYIPLMDQLIAAHQRGVDVSIVCDHSQAEGGAEKVQLQRLVDAGIPLLVTVSSRGGIDHSKYIVVDQIVVGFGSFNFSASAESQDNTFSIRSDQQLVQQFLANWQKDYNDGVGRHPDWQVQPTVAPAPPTP